MSTEPTDSTACLATSTRTSVHLSYYSHSRREMLEFIPLGVHQVLDMGCGGGEFGKLLQTERGCRVTGVEPCLDAFTVAQTKLHRVFLSSAESFLASHRDRYDLICFNDVLEHFVAPWAQLRACRRLLEPTRGVILASVPNIRYYLALSALSHN